MSLARSPRAAVAVAALAAATSLVSCNFNKDSVALVDVLVPDVPTVKINFSCVGGASSIGLTDAQGNSAWAIRRHPNQPITWQVPPDVTINSIAGKTEALPIVHDPGDPQGGSLGTPYKGKVKSDTAFAASQKTFNYAINVTCHPGQPDSVRLVLDPEFIVKKP